MRVKVAKASVRFLPQVGHFLYVNDIREDEFFSYNERISCLRKANDVFDSELIDAAEKYKHTPYGAYLWCYTAEFLRGENITDLIRIRFIQELIYLLVNKFDHTEVYIETFWSKTFLRELKKNHIHYRINKWLFIKYNIRERIKWVYYSFLTSYKNFKFIFYKSNPAFKGIIIDANRSPESHRLDDLRNFNSINLPLKYFSGQEHQMSGFPKKAIVVFRRELSIILAFKGVVETFKAGFFLYNAKKNISAGLASYLSGIFDFRLFDLILYGLSAEKYFKKSSIQHIVHVSTMTKPAYRLLMSNAKQNNIPFTLVSSRSLKILSSSERLYPCDVKNYSNTHLPDYFIVRDQFSTKVFENYQELWNSIFIGSRFKDIKKTAKQTEKKGVAVLIMFTHVHEVCEKMIGEMAKLNLDNLNISKIFFRSHPAVPIKKEKIQAISGDIIVQDISGLSYEALKNYNCITVSGPTTGTLESASFGSAILWLPYVWSDGILFDDFMSVIGQKCTNTAEFKHFFYELITNHKSLITSIKSSLMVVSRQFTSNSLISENILGITSKNINYESSLL